MYRPITVRPFKTRNLFITRSRVRPASSSDFFHLMQKTFIKHPTAAPEFRMIQFYFIHFRKCYCRNFLSSLLYVKNNHVNIIFIYNLAFFEIIVVTCTYSSPW